LPQGYEQSGAVLGSRPIKRRRFVILSGGKSQNFVEKDLLLRVYPALRSR
jgi:hypothetical protein